MTQFTPKLSIGFFKTFCLKMLWVFQYRLFLKKNIFQNKRKPIPQNYDV